MAPSYVQSAALIGVLRHEMVPERDASRLRHLVLERSVQLDTAFLDGRRYASEKIEATCLTHHGASLNVMIEALIETDWCAKTERADVTRALYRTAVELDNEALIEAFAARVDAATLAMLASASDWNARDLGSVNLTLVTVIFGTVRNAFERNLPPGAVEALRGHLLQMCRVYLGVAGVEAYPHAPDHSHHHAACRVHGNAADARLWAG